MSNATIQDTKPNSLELREQLSHTIAENKQLHTLCEKEQRDMSQEEEEKFNGNIERAEKLKVEIRQAEKREYLAKEEADLAKPIRRITPERIHYSSNKRSSFNGALRAWLTGGKANIEDMRSADEWGVMLIAV